MLTIIVYNLTSIIIRITNMSITKLIINMILINISTIINITIIMIIVRIILTTTTTIITVAIPIAPPPPKQEQNKLPSCSFLDRFRATVCGRVRELDMRRTCNLETHPETSSLELETCWKRQVGNEVERVGHDLEHVARKTEPVPRGGSRGKRNGDILSRQV